MKQKMIGSLDDILGQPEKYQRVWTVELKGELIEGLWLIVPMNLSSNFYLYYKNGEVWLTDNLEDQNNEI